MIITLIGHQIVVKDLKIGGQNNVDCRLILFSKKLLLTISPLSRQLPGPLAALAALVGPLWSAGGVRFGHAGAPVCRRVVVGALQTALAMVSQP